MMKRLISFSALIALLLLTGCKETLLSRLSELQANQVLAALSEAGIAANKEQTDENNWVIAVQGDQLGRASALLQSQGIPHAKHVPMGEIFKKDGLIPSASEERIRYVAGLSEELSMTLRKIPGIVDARVHVVIPHNDPLASRVKPSTASVFVKHRDKVDMSIIGNNIKDLVAAGVDGLDIKNVALFSFPVAEVSPPKVVPATHVVQAAIHTTTNAAGQVEQSMWASAFEAISIAIGGFLLVGALVSRTYLG
jgi:type III secretion protein J